MDCIDHEGGGVTNSWTQLNKFHFHYSPQCSIYYEMVIIIIFLTFLKNLFILIGS